MRAPAATITRLTMCPLMSRPRMLRAAAAASSGVVATLTPPALPRPPVFTCALTTTTPPSFSAAALASSGVSATMPASTGTPYCSNRSLAWYSYRSTRVFQSVSAHGRQKGLWSMSAAPCHRTRGRSTDDNATPSRLSFSFVGCSSLRGSAVVVWLCVVLVGFCWCCLVEVFLGLVVVLGDGLLDLFVGCGSEGGVCWWVASVPSVVVFVGFCVAVRCRGQWSTCPYGSSHPQFLLPGWSLIPRCSHTERSLMCAGRSWMDTRNKIRSERSRLPRNVWRYRVRAG